MIGAGVSGLIDGAAVTVTERVVRKAKMREVR